MYAVLHGGLDRDLRKLSIDYLSQLPFDGFAIGAPSLFNNQSPFSILTLETISAGGSVGRSRMDLVSLIEWMSSQLPKDKPCHLLGIGLLFLSIHRSPPNNGTLAKMILTTGDIESVGDCIPFGIDTFDSAYPTR